MSLGRTSILRLTLVAALLVAAWWLLRSSETPNTPLPAAPPARTTVQPPAPTPAVAQSATPEAAPAFATFRGRVIDAATRAPVREFELRFAEWGRASPDELVPGPKRFVTDDGHFEWPRLPAGRWQLIADAGGYQRFLVALELIQGRTTSEVLIPLTRGHTVRGRVYDEISNTGIASAFISFHETGQGSYDGKWRLRPQAQSQKDGSFVLDGVPPGRMTLQVGAKNYANRELDLVVDDDLAPLQIGLAAGGVIAGRLTAADGVTSVAGSTGLFRLDGDRSGSEGRTTESGEFSYWSLGPGRYRLTGRGPGGSATREFVISSGEQFEGVILALSGGGTIRGAVTGLRPGDLQQLFITLRPEGESSPEAQATINERGEYEVRNVQPGRARLSADVSMRRQLAKVIDVPANTDMTVDFDFPRGARVSGGVTQRGRPVAGAWLQPRPVEARKDGDLYLYGAATAPTGQYVLEDMPPGEYTIRIDGYKSRPFQVTGDTVFDIDASPQLAGRIVEDNGNVPIAAAELQLWPADPKAARIRALDRTDHFGRFSMAGLEPRDFVLTIYKPGYAMFRERIAFVSPILDKTIRLRRDAGVEVRAHDAATGKPLRKLVASEMLGDRPMIQISVPLDERGVGYVPGGLEGTTVAFWAEGYATQTFSGWNAESLALKFVR